jgi:hypothetical protein
VVCRCPLSLILSLLGLALPAAADHAVAILTAAVAARTYSLATPAR